MAEAQEPKPNPPPVVSRSEAVRRALEAGREGADEGTAYIRQEFGIELSPSLFLAAKATERRKGWVRHGKPGRKAKQAADAGGHHDADADDEEPEG